MPTTNEDILQTILTNINSLLTECLSDKEIMKQLDIPKTTFYGYKSMLHREAAEEFKKQRLDDIALRKELLEGRLKAILQPLLVRINQSQEPNSKISNRDLGSIAEIAKEIAIEINSLNMQGLKPPFQK
jgi:ACT domain-containing protein